MPKSLGVLFLSRGLSCIQKRKQLAKNISEILKIKKKNKGLNF